MVSKLPKKRSQIDTRAKLLKAALDIFAKEGYDAATTRAIAKRAGVNESLIHRYFESKLGLFWALKQQFREEFIKQFLAYEPSGNLEEEFVKFFKSKIQQSKQRKKFFKLVLSRAILDPKSREDMRNFASHKPTALLERFAEFRRRGKIGPGVDLEQLVGVLQTLSFSFSVLTDAIDCLPTEDGDRLMRSAAAMLVRGLTPVTNRDR